MLGIEIGNNTIKLIEVTKKAETIKIEKFSLLDTLRDCVVNGGITHLEPILEVISKELTSKKYKAKKAVVLIQSNQIIIRNAVIDKQPEKVIKQLLAIRPEEYLPVETSQYQIDFKITREFEEAGVNKQEILLVAAPNHIVLPMVNLIESLKLTPIKISIPSEALAKAFGAEARIVNHTDGDALIIDIGGKSTTATIVSKGHTVLTRIIEFGVDLVNETIESSFVNPNEEQLTDQGKNEYENYLKELIRPQIEYNVIAELERIIQFYYSRFENSPIRKIYLIGGGANIKGIETYIREALNIQTQGISEFTNVVEKPDSDFASYRRFFVNILGAINGI
jgi:type IV pilus assembly protein PilM